MSEKLEPCALCNNTPYHSGAHFKNGPGVYCDRCGQGAAESDWNAQQAALRAYVPPKPVIRPCFFCHSETVAAISASWHRHWVQCVNTECRYFGPLRSSEAEAIRKHNEIADIVNAAEKREGT